MLIAIFSDIHDQTAHMRQALRKAQEAGCTHLLFLGDMTTAATYRELREAWAHGLDMVAGNNDYPREIFQKLASESEQTRFHGESAQLTLDGRRIYMTHEPHNGVLYAAESGEFDLALFGHTHRSGQQTHGATIVANPGDLQGRYGAPSFAIYDTVAHRVRHVAL